MAKIIGNTTATPNPRPDWNQTDETKADYIKNKPNVVTQEVDPTVPAWAKEPTKPTYTAEEVGALPEDTTLAELPDDADHRTVSDDEKTTWNEKLDKTGGTITGDLVITGDLTVNGTTISEDHETIVVEDNMMVLNSNKVDLQTAVSGIAMNKNADSTYGAVYDPVDDTFKFGEGTLNEANEFEFNEGEGLPFAVREDSTQFADGHIVEWSADGNKLVDSGKTVEDFSLDGHGHVIDDVTKLQETLDTKVVLGEKLVNTDVAYIKDVPNTSAPYAAISKIGGMSYKSKNLFGGIALANKIKEVTSSSNTVINTTDKTVQYYAGDISGKVIYSNFKPNTRYTFIFEGKNTTSTFLNLRINYTDGTSKNLGGFTSSNIVESVRIVSESSKSIQNLSGEWNSGTTCLYYDKCGIFEGEVYYADFEPYYSELRDVKVTEVKSVGVNRLGGIALANRIKEIVPSAVINTATKTVLFGAGDVHTKVIYSNFKPNTRYVFYMKGQGNSNYANMRIEYTDGTATDFGQFINNVSTISSDASKSIRSLVGFWHDGNTELYYDECGIFEGYLEGFEPYTEHALAIPESVQNLEGYGFGIDSTLYNYVDLVNKKFVKNVHKILINGTTSLVQKVSSWNGVYYAEFRYTEKLPLAYSTPLCNTLTGDWGSVSPGTVSINASSVILLANADQTLTTVDMWNEWLTRNPTEIVYILATPITEDIPEIDNLIGVEGGGTLTFENEYGYDVPSEVEFHLNNNMEISANEFIGDLKGEAIRAKRANEASHAARADYATYDENGKNIKDNYASTGTSEIVESDTHFVDIPNDEQLANNAKIHKIGGMSRKCTNLLKLLEFNSDIAGVGVKTNPNANTVIINGTATSNGGRNIKMGQVTLKAGTYKLNAPVPYVVVSNSATNAYIAGPNPFTLTEETTVHVGFNFTQGETYNTTVNLWLNEGGVELPFEPYFSGLRAAKVTEVKSVGKNLFNKSNVKGVTITDTGFKFTNSDVSGAPVSIGALKDIAPTLKAGDVVTVSGNCVNGVNGSVYFYLASGAVDWYSNAFITITESNLNGDVYCYGKQNQVCEYNDIMITKYANASYSPYTEHTLEIPEDVQSLEGYGLGIDSSIYNYIDFENKKFHRNVKMVDLGSLEWIYNAQLGIFVSYNSAISTGYYITDLPLNNQFTNHYYDINVNAIVVYSNLSNATEFKNAVNGYKFVYELKNPETEDIAIANIIGVEGGSTIKFVNEYGYDINSTLEFYYGKKDRIHIDEVVGNLSGTAKKAEFAERDSKGNVIADTYFSKDNLKFVTDFNTKQYKVQADANNNLYVNVPWEGGGEGADGNYYHIPDYSSGLRLAAGVGVGHMYAPFANSSNSQQGVVAPGGDVTINNGVITVNDDSHNHIISNIDGLQEALNGKSDVDHNHDGRYARITDDMTNMGSYYGMAISAIGDTVGQSTSDNYYMVLDSGNTFKVGTQLNGATEVTWNKYYNESEVNSLLSGKLDTTGGIIYNPNSTIDAPLHIRANNQACYLGFRNNTGEAVGYYGFSASNVPQVAIADVGVLNLIHSGNIGSQSVAHSFRVGKEWTATTKYNEWSRLCYIPYASSIVGCSFMINVMHTRNNVVINDTFLCCAHHSGSGKIIKILGSEYTSGYSIRLGSDNMGNGVVEFYDDIFNPSGEYHNVLCSIIPIHTGNITVYEAFTATDGDYVYDTLTTTNEDIQATVSHANLATCASKINAIENNNLANIHDGGAGVARFDYRIFSGTSGLFPAKDNANAILTVNRHYGDYDTQLGFSGNGNLYLRASNGSAISSEPWKTLIDSSNYSLFALPLSGGTLTGQLKVNAPIFGYNYGNNQYAPAFVFDKQGTNYTGIGAGAELDTILFAPVMDNAWVSDYYQKWKFQGDVIADRNVYVGSNPVIHSGNIGSYLPTFSYSNGVLTIS